MPEYTLCSIDGITAIGDKRGSGVGLRLGAGNSKFRARRITSDLITRYCQRRSTQVAKLPCIYSVPPTNTESLIVSIRAALPICQSR